MTTYYPAKATSIAVKAGEELPSVDMLLQQVGVFKIRGRVYNSVTRHSGNDVYLNLVSKGSRVLWGFPNSANVQKDGSFELHDVLSGSYTLSAYWFDEGKSYSARQPIEVSNTDIDGLTLTIAPGVTHRRPAQLGRKSERGARRAESGGDRRNGRLLGWRREGAGKRDLQLERRARRHVSPGCKRHLPGLLCEDRPLWHE